MLRSWVYNYFTVHSSGSNFNVLYHACNILFYQVSKLQKYVSVYTSIYYAFLISKHSATCTWILVFGPVIGEYTGEVADPG